MRLLTWNSQGDLTLTRDLPLNETPTYAILSHTWGSDADEVTFTDIQQRHGQDKAGYQKILFCGEQARKDGIDHFWVDTCCIDKTNHVELSEAIVSMFRWYRHAKKCYVYLPDVKISDVQSTWESSLRISRWFTRGWTLQELLAPTVVEFFSHEKIFLGTKQTLAQLIYDITTIPLAALQGTPLAQFPISERIRWTEKRQTKREEDKAYCLLGIFDVFMPLIYGEGDNALRRLKNEINNRFGSDVAARLDDTDEVRPAISYRKRAPSVDVDYFVEQTSDFEQTAQILRPGEPRPMKRIRTPYETNGSEQSNGHSYCNTTINTSHMVIMGDHIQHPGQNPQHIPMSISQDKYEVLLKSLLFDRIDFRVNNVKKALLSTCQWLFRHPHFVRWHESDCLDQHSGFLWIKGKPGCGKSTLMKAALEWVRKQTGKKRGRHAIVPYFFNARALASLEKSSLGLYRTVIHHLLSSYPSLRTLFAERFAFKDPGQSGESWTTEELQDFLYDAVESNESFSLCLFIDALDEAEYEDDVRDMIVFLVQLSDRALAAGGSCRVQICLSSRHYPSISVGRGLSLVVEDQLEHGRDIEIYITKQLTCPSSPGIDDLRSQILKKSARIFLWVVLVVEMLNKLDDRGAPLSDMRARLETLPADLDKLFTKILIKSKDGIETSILFFQWMSFSMRLLEPAELFVALEYSKSPLDSTWVLPAGFSVPHPDRLAKFIINCSRGLVEVVEVGPQQAPVVQFIHETVREFLLKENGLASVVPALAANLIGISHEILRIACVRCISMNKIPEEYEHYCKANHKTKALLETFRSEMRLKLPFVDYAVVHVLDHAEQAQKHDLPQQTFLVNYGEPEGPWTRSHRLWWNVLERYKSKKIPPNQTFLHFLRERRYFALLPAILTVLDPGTKCCDDHGYILQVASHYGYTEIVQIILNKGAAEILNGRPYYAEAFYTASEEGHEKIVQILLDKGVGVHAQGFQHCTNALRRAVRRGHEKVVQILLDQRMNLDIANQQLVNDMLCQASEYGHEKIVQMLLNIGREINLAREAGNALYMASLGGKEKVVQMLLENGADVNAQGVQSGSALHVAVAGGYEKVVQILLENGADVNMQGEYDGSALQAASYHGKEKIIRMLLENGADVNAPGGVHHSALQAAAISGHEKIVQILLENGADVNAQGGESGSALQAAARGGYEKVVQMLLDNGADVNAQGGSYGSPLQVASRFCKWEIERILLEHGAKLKLPGMRI